MPETAIRGRVLVTRPAGQGDILMAALKDDNWQAVHMPLAKIEANSDEQTIKNQILNLDEYDFVVSVSANASRFAVEWIDQYWPQPPIGIQWLAIGQASATPFHDLDIYPQIPEGAHSEGLLNMNTLKLVKDRKVLILRGFEGRETLAIELTQRGALVTYLPLYRRVKAPLGLRELDQLLLNQKIDHIVLTSGELLTHFVEHLEQKAYWLDRVTLLLPSQRVMDKAMALGAQNVVNCQGANPESIVNALNRLP